MVDPKDIPKFKNELAIPFVFEPKVVTDAYGKVTHEYEVDASSFEQQMLPEGFPKTRVYGYGGLVKTKRGIEYKQSTPGPSFEVTRGIPAAVRWINKLDEPHFLPIDGTIHWAKPEGQEFKVADYPIPFNPETRKGIPEIQYPVPMVTHLHGGENPPIYDGHPDSWFTHDMKHTGPQFETNTYYYNNQQPQATLWYHDHTLGMTRANVYAGLAGFYIINNPNVLVNKKLPSGEFDVPLAIQDRKFDDHGQLLTMENVGTIPKVHPYWTAETVGNTIVVNGKVWPNFNVKRTQYRFRLLNGSNARFYRMSLLHKEQKLAFIQIATDGGLMPAPVTLEELVIAPGERAEILIDFSDLLVGSQLIMKNDAPVGFSPSKPPLKPDDPTTDIMQFSVVESHSKKPQALPKILNTIPNLKTDARRRLLVLNELLSKKGKPLMLLLEGVVWGAEVTELPLVGSTEDWDFINITGDTHPMHLHLVQFQIISRQAFQKDKYKKDWLAINGDVPFDHPTKSLPIEDYLTGDPRPAEANEQGWNDIVHAHPGDVTKIRVRFAPIDLPSGKVAPGENQYPFNPSEEPGYVWHCHILDHEDNEMMRPYYVTQSFLRHYFLS